jgi:hypothetical protein
VSLSALGNLPQPIEQLSFAGGIQIDDDASPDVVDASRIVIHTEQEALGHAALNSPPSRPR